MIVKSIVQKMKKKISSKKAGHKVLFPKSFHAHIDLQCKEDARFDKTWCYIANKAFRPAHARNTSHLIKPGDISQTEHIHLDKK